MLRILIVIALVAAIATSAFAAASALTVDAGLTQAGSDTLTTCDANGIAVVGYGVELDDLTSHFLQITDVNAACAGAEVGAVAQKAGQTIGTYNGFLTTQVGPGTYNIPLVTAPIKLADIESVNIVITAAGSVAP